VVLPRLSRPRAWLPLLAAAVVAAAVALIGLLSRNWFAAVIAVLCAVLVVLLVLLVRMLVRRESDERLGSGLAGDARLQAADARDARQSAAADLRSRFREALAEIRRTIDPYDVPWFLVIGTPGSGKSALLSASGLHLPAQYARSRVFGPTPTCEFFLFNEAIALDTAGRYTAGEGEADREEWRLLLGQLRRARSDLPVNGVVFAIPAPSLLSLPPAELEEQARQLRRRLNEIEVWLGVEAPIYIVLTKADQIEGFSEFLSRLPAERQSEAFGWTCDQRRLADPAQRIAEAFSAMRERLDAILHELLMREPDAAAKRRIFVFPQELEELGRAAARFAATAFKRDIYNPTPFLRGVYLTSVASSGHAVSPTLQRLGQSWGHTSHAGSGGSPRQIRELWTEVMIGDEQLALPKSRLGPRSRQIFLGVGGLCALAVLALWGVSFAQNYRGTRALARAAAQGLSADPGLEQLDGLRVGIEREADVARGSVNRLGFHFLGAAVEDARRGYLWSFENNFDRYTRENLERVLRQGDEKMFLAAVVLAGDLAYLESAGEAAMPDLSPYLPRRVADPESYAQVYSRFVAWLPASERDELRRKQAEVLSRAAADLVSLGPLEAQTLDPGGSFRPVRYEDVGLPVPASSAGGVVPGIYTAEGYRGLFARLMAAVEAAGALPQFRISETRRQYADRFDRSWRAYLLEVPTLPRADADVRRSPYLALLEQIHANASVDLERAEPVPPWLEMLALLRGPAPDAAPAEGGRTPWLEYTAALENLSLDLEDAVADPARALALSREVASGQPGSFADALALVRRIVPHQGDAAARTKLTQILEAPILDGYSAVLASALRELDRRWSERIASRYGEALSAQDFAALYDPSSGALQAFVAEELGPFYRDGAPARLLADRAMPLGPRFLEWMEQAGVAQRRLFAGGSGSHAVRLAGVPSAVVGAEALRVKRRELRLVCPDGPQEFVYREGSGTHTFRWSSSCQSLVLRVLVGAEGVPDQELAREWRGPQALPSFLQQGEEQGGGVLKWVIEGPDGIRVEARYRIESGGEISQIVHRAPPSSLGS
jgi:hypothetical protein